MGALLYAVLITAYVVFGTPKGPIGEETVIVLPGENGKIGGVVVRRGNQEQILDTAYATSHISANGVLERKQVSPEEVKKDYGKTIAALPRKPAAFIVYFMSGTDALTQDSKAKLDQVLAEIRTRPSPDILLIGHTDTVGSLGSNDVLSRQRAEKVRDILVRAGIKAEIEVTGRGKRDLLVPTGENVEELHNRGVEIYVR